MMKFFEYEGIKTKWWNIHYVDVHMPSYNRHIIFILFPYASQFRVAHVLYQDKLPKIVIYSLY